MRAVSSKAPQNRRRTATTVRASNMVKMMQCSNCEGTYDVLVRVYVYFEAIFLALAQYADSVVHKVIIIFATVHDVRYRV